MEVYYYAVTETDKEQIITKCCKFPYLETEPFSEFN